MQLKLVSSVLYPATILADAIDAHLHIFDQSRKCSLHEALLKKFIDNNSVIPQHP